MVVFRNCEEWALAMEFVSSDHLLKKYAVTHFGLLYAVTHFPVMVFILPFEFLPPVSPTTIGSAARHCASLRLLLEVHRGYHLQGMCFLCCIQRWAATALEGIPNQKRVFTSSPFTPHCDRRRSPKYSVMNFADPLKQKN